MTPPALGRNLTRCDISVPREEAGAFVLTSIESGPLMSLIILGAAGSAHFEPQIFVGAVWPFLVGFLLGNLDPKLRDFFGPGCQLMIPFSAVSLGNTIDLATLLSPLSALGVGLALTVIVLTAIPLILADRLIGGGTGTAGIAASSSAGAAAATPWRSPPSRLSSTPWPRTRRCWSLSASW